MRDNPSIAKLRVLFNDTSWRLDNITPRIEEYIRVIKTPVHCLIVKKTFKSIPGTNQYLAMRAKFLANGNNERMTE